MLEVKLTVKDDGSVGDADVRQLDGMHIFGSVMCPKHKMGVMLVVPQGTPLDLECVTSSIHHMLHRLIDAANRKISDEN